MEAGSRLGGRTQRHQGSSPGAPPTCSGALKHLLHTEASVPEIPPLEHRLLCSSCFQNVLLTAHHRWQPKNEIGGWGYRGLTRHQQGKEEMKRGGRRLGHKRRLRTRALLARVRSRPALPSPDSSPLALLSPFLLPSYLLSSGKKQVSPSNMLLSL